MQRLCLATASPQLWLRRLLSADAQDLHQLMMRNRAHLTAHGDYLDQTQSSVSDLKAELTWCAERNWRFGIYYQHELIGRVDLLGIEPPRYGVGYWLSEAHTGNGFAKQAVGAVIDFAAATCGASDLFAGVSHGNTPSIALLSRLGFQPVARFDTYIRYHLAIR